MIVLGQTVRMAKPLIDGGGLTVLSGLSQRGPMRDQWEIDAEIKRLIVVKGKVLHLGPRGENYQECVEAQIVTLREFFDKAMIDEQEEDHQWTFSVRLAADAAEQWMNKKPPETPLPSMRWEVLITTHEAFHSTEPMSVPFQSRSETKRIAAQTKGKLPTVKGGSRSRR